MGPKINTEGNEMFPFIQQDSVLYFASDGYAGLGGTDIYKTDLHGNLAYKVLNMGYPVNTRFDDFGLILDETGKSGYFASNRPGGKGSDDIYGFAMATIVIESIVASAKNGEPIMTPDVKLIDSRTGKELTGTVQGNKVYFEVPPGEHYILKSSQDHFTAKTQVVPTRHWQFGDTLTVNFSLDPIKPTSAPLWVKVMDPENNQPATGAQVYLLNEVSSEEKYLRTDSAGLITFEASFTASYALIADKGKKSGVLSSIIANDPAVLANDTLLLPIAAFQPEDNDPGQPLFLEGLVIDITNQESVPNARVRLFDKETQKEIKLTQKNGVAGFSVKPGNYILKVDKDTYTDRVVVISARPSPSGGKVRVKIELQRQPPASTPLVAYIYDPVTGKAQAGYEIYLLDEMTSDETRGISDGQGHFKFEAKLASSYAIIAEKGNRSGFLSGITAHDPASQPNEVIQIPVFGRSPEQDLISATPDSTVTNQSETAARPSDKLPVSPTEKQPATLAPVIVKGAAVDLADGKPLTDIAFTLINAKTKQEVKGYIENGFQYFPLQPDESYLLKSNKDRYANKTTLINTWENNPGDTINVQVDMTRSIPVSAALVVYVYDEESGKPEPGASVFLLDETTSDQKNLKTGENGILQFTAPFTSSFAVVAQKNDKTGSRGNISANPALSRQDTIRVALAGKAKMNEENRVVITVSTTDLDQRDTLWNAIITLTDAVTRQELKGIPTKDGMVFQAKPNGQYVLSGQKTGYKDKSELVSTEGIIPANTIRKKLLMEAETPIWRTQMVQVYDAENQQPVAGAAVLLLDETTGEEKNLVTNKYGNFQFEAFLASSYSIMADKGDKSGWLTGVVAGDSAIMTKGVIRIPLGRPFTKDPERSGLLLAYGGESGTRATPVRGASAGSDSAPRIFSIKNISGAEQVFVYYKSRIFEFKSEENLQYLVPVNTKQKLIVGQQEGAIRSPLASQLEKVFASSSIAPREVVQISSIFYELNQSELTAVSQAELDKLAALLLANPSLRIVMKSYADSRESYAYNYNLSNRRSKAAKAYIAAKGIGKGRMQTYFFGEKYPVNGCTDGVHCSESEHQKNRRTEFKLVF